MEVAARPLATRITLLEGVSLKIELNAITVPLLSIDCMPHRVLAARRRNSGHHWRTATKL
jgi:hypothetical protein